MTAAGAADRDSECQANSSEINSASFNSTREAVRDAKQAVPGANEVVLSATGLDSQQAPALDKELHNRRKEAMEAR